MAWSHTAARGWLNQRRWTNGRAAKGTTASKGKVSFDKGERCPELGGSLGGEGGLRGRSRYAKDLGEKNEEQGKGKICPRKSCMVGDSAKLPWVGT